MSLAQQVAELTTRIRRLEKREPPLAGNFIDTATSPGDELRVKAPDWDQGDHAFGPVRWHPIGGALPQAGDECMIIERSDGIWTVAGWWSESQGTGIAQSTIDALDARLAALEDDRTVHGVVSSAGAVVRGTGFTAARNGPGLYTVTYTTPFASTPTLTFSWGDTAGGGGVEPQAESASAFSVVTYNTAGDVLDNSFGFHAIGPA